MVQTKATKVGSHQGRPVAVVSTVFYDLLGVDPSASQRDICRAFRLRAMKLHPDKRPDEDYEKTKSDFQELQRAYDVLGDPEKRRQYDETGNDEDCVVDPDSISRISKIFRKVTVQEIESFELSYKGSAEERQDVAAFYARTNGDFKELFEYIPLSRPHEVDRFLDILESVWQETRDLPKKQFMANCEALRKEAAKFASKESTEEKELDQEARAKSIQSLALAIKSKQSDRESELNSFLEALTSKYNGRKKSHRSVEPKKRCRGAPVASDEQSTAKAHRRNSSGPSDRKRRESGRQASKSS